MIATYHQNHELYRKFNRTQLLIEIQIINQFQLMKITPIQLKKIGLMLIVFLAIGSLNAQSKKKVEELKVESQEAKADFLKADWQMEKYFSEAYGYVIFPNVGKGGLGIGGAAGNGVVYEEGVEIGMAKLTQITIGFQAGGQAYKEIIFFEDKAAMDRFKDNKFEVAAQASAVAATEGAAAHAKYVDGVMIYTMQKGGIMYEASVGGQKLKFNPF
jgi:lipid-binding SYLF domain-containing protein